MAFKFDNTLLSGSIKNTSSLPARPLNPFLFPAVRGLLRSI